MREKKYHKISLRNLILENYKRMQRRVFQSNGPFVCYSICCYVYPRGQLCIVKLNVSSPTKLVLRGHICTNGIVYFLPSCTYIYFENIMHELRQKIADFAISSNIKEHITLNIRTKDLRYYNNLSSNRCEINMFKKKIL